jgi:PhnB protein
VTIEPELWVSDTAVAVAFYEGAFGAETVHRVGGPADPDGVAQLSVGAARFWVAGAAPDWGRLDPLVAGGATARLLLVVEDPAAVIDAAVRAGAALRSAPANEHGWLLGRIRDPFGHEWEIGHPLGRWPPAH